MNQLKYVFIFFLVGAFSCVSKNYFNNEDNRYQIYAAIINERDNVDKTPWYEDTKIPERYLTDDSLSIYLRYKDSMKILMKKKKFYILINDTTIGSTAEMQELKYSIDNNRLFWKEYFNGDSSFKSFILNWRPLNLEGKNISLEKLTPTVPYHLSHDNPKNENDYILASLNFSDVIFDDSKTKAIVYLVDGGGTFYFLEKINTQWFIKNNIVIWTIGGKGSNRYKQTTHTPSHQKVANYAFNPAPTKPGFNKAILSRVVPPLAYLSVVIGSFTDIAK